MVTKLGGTLAMVMAVGSAAQAHCSWDAALAPYPGGGVRIVSVVPDGTAAQLGLGTDDVIVRVNGVRVNTPKQAQDAIAACPPHLTVFVMFADGHYENVDGDLEDDDPPVDTKRAHRKKVVHVTHQRVPSPKR